ncbi:Bug family tripartite tricarboxylate transporter substrate binding protein [Chelatococcus asaccharovorans]|uniref:Bug family tripartite tricarboxylate transporter substrate binding protein n=1 Tax=Chelatococcus asaccharovorans TaxID=28210 RepID=UPI00224C688D|nr:tripartite tricarboxylate transporter substrate binding protein [Chelatococcus asaccharovorans]CAH1649746.1 Tripartite-type tricarboxylate transporter receptor subunit TctC [Chelatococcus asaccharovorans]CAH1691792.1 Tripartite-type tricarboxylate transporter receptor subunit TctC [Chelatococcus asaccharovorans]
MTFRAMLFAAAVTMAATLSGASRADWQPSGPITIIVPFGAGGSTDIFGRVFATEMQKQTGWTVLVENRPGAGGLIGQIAVANAKPDGQTLGLSSTSMFAVEPFMPDASGELQPDSVDFMGTLSVIPYAIVAGSKAPFDDLKGLAEYSKAKGPAKFSSTSAQLTLAMEQLAKEIGIKFVAAQTSGSGESLQLVAGRHADFTISGGVHVPFVLDGRMKVLAHFMDERGSYAPNAKTVDEQGAVLPLRNYFLFNAPKGLPADVKATLAKAIDNAVNSDAVRKYGESIFVTARNLGPEGSTKDVMEQAAVWKARLGK